MCLFEIKVEHLENINKAIDKNYHNHSNYNNNTFFINYNPAGILLADPRINKCCKIFFVAVILFFSYP